MTAKMNWRPVNLGFPFPARSAAALLLVTASLAPNGKARPQPIHSAEMQAIVERSQESAALILIGSGAGRLEQTGVGAVVRSDGVILTECALMEDAREVQVRLKSGDVFDQVDLIGCDERRGVAALKIAASRLPALEIASRSEPLQGEELLLISHPRKLHWSVTPGTVSAMRPASEVAGAGEGYRLIQHTAPKCYGRGCQSISIDLSGKLVGIGLSLRGDSGFAFAVPAASVAGLADGANRTALGSGAALEPGYRPLSAKQLLETDPEEQLKKAKTVYVKSSSVFIKPDQLWAALQKRSEFKELGLLLLGGWDTGRRADLTIHLDRPLFTYYFTYSITDNSTGVVLGTGKVTAFDGNAAAPMLAKEILTQVKKSREKDSKSAAPKDAAGG